MQPLALQTHRIPTPLGNLHVQVGGSGPAILFWPSLLMTGDMWHGVARGLTDRFQVILVDPPGHGGSDPLTGTFDFDSCADCILSILDTLGIKQTHYVGNSWGAMIGGTFAARHPERLGICVLMNGTGSACGTVQRLKFQFMIATGRLLRGIRGPLRASAVDAFLGSTSKRERPEVVAAVRKALGCVDFRSVRWAVDSVVPRRPDQHALFATIRTPTLVVAGVEDATFPVAETRAMAEAIPGSQFVVMPRTAHLAGLECPEATRAMIEEFIQRRG